MELGFIISFAILCLVVSAYMAGRLTGPIQIALTIPGEVSVSFSGSHAVAMALDGTVQIRNGGVKLPDGALVLSPIDRSKRTAQ